MNLDLLFPKSVMADGKYSRHSVPCGFSLRNSAYDFKDIDGEYLTIAFSPRIYRENKRQFDILEFNAGSDEFYLHLRMDEKDNPLAAFVWLLGGNTEKPELNKRIRALHDVLTVSVLFFVLQLVSECFGFVDAPLYASN